MGLAPVLAYGGGNVPNTKYGCHVYYHVSQNLPAMEHRLGDQRIQSNGSKGKLADDCGDLDSAMAELTTMAGLMTQIFINS